eukprot:IDg23957t1
MWTPVFDLHRLIKVAPSQTAAEVSSRNSENPVNRLKAISPPTRQRSFDFLNTSPASSSAFIIASKKMPSLREEVSRNMLDDTALTDALKKLASTSRPYLEVREDFVKLVLLRVRWGSKREDGTRRVPHSDIKGALQTIRERYGVSFASATALTDRVVADVGAGYLPHLDVSERTNMYETEDFFAFRASARNAPASSDDGFSTTAQRAFSADSQQSASEGSASESDSDVEDDADPENNADMEDGADAEDDADAEHDADTEDGTDTETFGGVENDAEPSTQGFPERGQSFGFRVFRFVGLTLLECMLNEMVSGNFCALGLFT